MLNTKSVGAIIPIYDTEDYLSECLDSVVHQTSMFDAVILIDDGSTDHSSEICDLYATEYNYIQVIHRDNMGLGSARNLGVDRIDCDYVLFVDSDDYLDKDTVRAIKGILGECSPDAIYYNGVAFEHETGSLRVFNPYSKGGINIPKMLSGIAFLYALFPRKYSSSACMCAYRTGLLKDERVRFHEGVLYEDNCFSLEFITKAKSVIYLNKDLYYRRYRNGSIITSPISEKKLRDLAITAEDVLRYLSRYNSAWWNDELLILFACDYCCQLIYKYNQCLSLKMFEVKAETQNIIDKIIDNIICATKKYMDGDSNHDINDVIMISVMFHKLNGINPNYTKDNQLIINECKDILNNHYLRLLKQLPLQNEELNVAIFGAGVHTKSLLMTYDRLLGDIRASITILDTYKSNISICGYRVVNIADAYEEPAHIIISGYYLQEEMSQEMRKRYPEVDQFLFYDGDTRVNLFPSDMSFLYE